MTIEVFDIESEAFLLLPGSTAAQYLRRKAINFRLHYMKHSLLSRNYVKPSYILSNMC